VFRKHLSFKFGQVSVEELFKAVFIIGLIPMIIIGLKLPSNIGIGQISIFNIRAVIVYILSGFVLLFSVLVTIVIWKLFCELIFLVFKSLEIYIKKNKL
jgi:hypothetical protein